MYFFADYDVVADVGVPMPPDSDKLECFQDFVNVIFETPNPLEKLANVAGVSLIFALFLSAFNTYICLVTSVVPFCLCLMLCALFIYVSAMLIVF